MNPTRTASVHIRDCLPKKFHVLCPFHDEKTPSCGISTAEEFWTFRCLSCGASGDVVASGDRLVMVRADRSTP